MNRFVFSIITAGVFSLVLGVTASFGQMAVGTAHKKQTNACASFGNTVGLEFKKPNGSGATASELARKLREEMEDRYAGAQISVQTSRYGTGFAIAARKKHSGFDCYSKFYYIGFGDNMIEAKARAERQLEKCDDCEVLQKMQL